MRTGRSILSLALPLLMFPAPVLAERLTLTFLPPDLPPANVCNVEPERFDESETQEAEAEGGTGGVLDNSGRLGFLSSDIHNLTRQDADRWFDFIMALISRRAELDPGYAGVSETFERIETYLAADRLDELAQTGLIQSLTYGLDQLSWSETVRLSRFYLNGLGVEKDRAFATNLILDQAYLGNADALMEVLRLQLRGGEVGDWSLSAEETAQLAFGGMIGRMNRGLCARAERMAREYIDGDLLTPNADLAYAWRKFAADMGGGEAAWRVVEHHLNATGERKNEAALRHYLSLAVTNGFVVMPEDAEDLVETGAQTEEEIRRVLGHNHGLVGSAERSSAVPFLVLDVRRPTTSISEDGAYLQYLREISTLPGVPGHVLTRLAKEVLLRKGRWNGEAEAMPVLLNAVALGDAEAMTMVAEMLLRRRDDPESFREAETLLIDAVTRHGHSEAMWSLDTLYRCQSVHAPMLAEAEFWAQAGRAADIEPVSISATDLARMDAALEPEIAARIQSLAIKGHSGSAADLLQHLQSNPLAPEVALNHWAKRVSQSDVSIEKFVGQEYELALTPGQRHAAVELFRRVYLDVGASISLDLAVILTEHAGRNPVVAAEILQILNNSGGRGQGAAIRLLMRLTGSDPEEVYAQFAPTIEDRGDFIALMVAAPFLTDDAFEKYMNRAVSIMSCTTKDVLELADAYAARNLSDEAAHWLTVGQAIEGGNSLSRLGLSTRQMSDFNTGLTMFRDPLARPIAGRDVFDQLRQKYLAVSSPEAPDFDAVQAGAVLAEVFQLPDRKAFLWALNQYRKADRTVRTEADSRIDIRSGLVDAAEAGDPVAQYETGLLLRATAMTPGDLESSTRWLERAAEAGHGEAMVEYAYATAFGIGRPADPKLGLVWLDRAEDLFPGKGRDLRVMLSAMVSE